MKYSSERGQERDRLTARIKELEQRDQENCGIMVMSGNQVEWYARKLSESQQQLATAQEERNVAIIKREQVIAWRKQDQEMINGLFQQLAEWDERIKELERTLAAHGMKRYIVCEENQP